MKDKPPVRTATSPEQGLSESAAVQKRRQFGYNEIAENQSHPLLKLLAKFWGPIPWLIEIAVILSALTKDWVNFAIISTLLLVNALVGFFEEHQASNTIAALKSKLAIKAIVKRDDIWKNVPARKLVPGDLVRLRIGAIVPADCKIVSGSGLSVDQAALTGESLPVDKKAGDEVYAGAIVKQGEADATVTATGIHTFFGKSTELLQENHHTSHFQKAILNIGNFLIVLVTLLIILIFIVSIRRGESTVETLQFSLILLVAAIPTALPTVLSVTMAIGAKALAARKAIVTRLTAVEELAGMDLLCSDKTGTLTQNKLTLGEPVLYDAKTKEELYGYAALASRAEDNDAIDEAILKSMPEQTKQQRLTVTNFTPYNPVLKRIEVETADEKGRRTIITKGAPQVVLKWCKLDGEKKLRVAKEVNHLAAAGYRSLGVALQTKNKWSFLGLISLYDPPREDTKDTIDELRRSGIDIKMVTGDHTDIAREIGRQVDLGSNILDISSFAAAHKLKKADDLNGLDRYDGFAQVYPEHKYLLVDHFQRFGHIVGMTGDGVNDAPALKKADVGIAVANATDAARSAADIVLMAPGLNTIIAAIREGRRIFVRMQNYSVYRIAETIRVLFFMTLSILIFGFYPLSAMMIVLLSLLNDLSIISIAFDNAEAPDKPEHWNMKNILSLGTVLGIMGVVASFLVFIAAENIWHVDRSLIQTLMYLKLSVAGHLTIFITRTRGPFFKAKPAPLLLYAVLGTQLIATLLATTGILMPAIPLTWVLLVWGYALAWLLVNDTAKRIAYRFIGKK